jgi:hypothetical protein
VAVAPHENPPPEIQTRTGRPSSGGRAGVQT